MTERSPASSAGKGRPRSEQAKVAVMDTARILFEQQGYAGATIEAISGRSGVAKTTIYRWWPNRVALLVDVLVEMAMALVPPPRGNDPMRAMRTELRGIAGALNGPLGRLLMSLLGEAQQDAQVRKVLVNRLFRPRTEASAANIGRAQTDGAIRADVPPEVAIDLLVGPLFYRAFVQHHPVSEAYVKQVLEYVMEGLRMRPARRERRR